MKKDSKSRTSTKENNLVSKKRTERLREGKQSTQRKRKSANKKKKNLSILPPKLNSKNVDKAHTQSLDELNALSKLNGTLTDEDIQEISKLLSAGDQFKICLIKVLIDNKVAKKHGMSESQFFGKTLQIEKSVLSRIKQCIRILRTLFGDDYTTYPTVSRDTLLTLSKILKLSEKTNIEVDIREIWEDAKEISEKNGNKRVVAKDIRSVALSKLPEEIFDQKISEENKSELDNYLESSESEINLLTISLELDVDDFCYEEANKQVKQCNCMQSLRHNLVNINQEIESYDTKLDDDNSLSPFHRLLVKQDEEFEDLFKEHQQEFDELVDGVFTHLDGLEKLQSNITELSLIHI